MKKEGESHKRHRNIIYSLVMLLLILQIVGFFVLSSQIAKTEIRLNEEVKALRESFTQSLQDYNQIYQAEFKQISQTLLEQTEKQESFKQEIKLLKSSKSDFSGIIEEAVKGVVSVSTERTAATGFVISEDGYVVTNYHVIEGNEKISILTYDRNVMDAQLVGFDGVRDLALLKVEGDFYDLDLADSDDLQVGNKVIAIGNPLGLSFSVSEGIISGLDRIGPNGLDEYIQTDVSLNPGNSGGPLINTEGDVVGINNFKVGDSEGLGFALESNAIKESINKLANHTIIR